MYCPGCGSATNDDLKFCRQCGANLRIVRDAMVSRSMEHQPHRNQDWLANLVSAGTELKQRLEGTAEEKRANEIKSGVITCFVGIGISIFLYFFMEVIAKQNPPNDAEILRHVWMAGIIPFMVGIGLLFNGFFVTRRLMKLKEQPTQPSQSQFQAVPSPMALPAKTTDQLVVDVTASPNFSISEDTTAQLAKSAAPPLQRDTQ